MASDCKQSGSGSSQGPSYTRNTGSDGDTGFECNICFDLAQDPIVTLCGHLFCWPCLYKWLHLHSKSQECPVCEAMVEEEKLVPLYGRGKNTTYPRSKAVPGVEIPNRPMGQRPETAPPPPTGFGGLLPTLLGLNLYEFPGFGVYGTPNVFPQQAQGQPHGNHAHRAPPQTPSQAEDTSLMMLSFLALMFVFITLVLM